MWLGMWNDILDNNTVELNNSLITGKQSVTRTVEEYSMVYMYMYMYFYRVHKILERSGISLWTLSWNKLRALVVSGMHVLQVHVIHVYVHVHVGKY